METQTTCLAPHFSALIINFKPWHISPSLVWCVFVGGSYFSDIAHSGLIHWVICVDKKCMQSRNVCWWPMTVAAAVVFFCWVLWQVAVCITAICWTVTASPFNVFTQCDQESFAALHAKAHFPKTGCYTFLSCMHFCIHIIVNCCALKTFKLQTSKMSNGTPPNRIPIKISLFSPRCQHFRVNGLHQL